MQIFKNFDLPLFAGIVVAATGCGDDIVVIDLAAMNDSGLSGRVELREDAAGQTLFPKIISWVELQGDGLQSEVLGGTVYTVDNGTCDELGERSTSSNYVGIARMNASNAVEPAFEALILGEMNAIRGQRFAFVVDVIDPDLRTVRNNRHVACGVIP